LGKKTTKTKSESQPWAPAQPILTGAGQGILDMVNKAQPGQDALLAQLNGIIPGLAAKAGDTSMLNGGTSYINGTLGGKYLNSNPYTTALAKQAGNDALNSINGSFSTAGRTGSFDNKAAAAKGVSQAENAILFQNYQNERNLQNQAASLLPAYQSSQFAGYQPLLGAMQLAGTLPYAGANALGNIGGLYGGYGTQTGTQPGGWGNALGGILGAGLSGWASGGFAPIAGISDRRLKTNIKKVGEAADGLGIYDWNWKADPNGPTVRGVIADEVERLRPWAHIPNFKGDYAGVNYAALGSLA
jgi:hypothetical protein